MNQIPYQLRAAVLGGHSLIPVAFAIVIGYPGRAVRRVLPSYLAAEVVAR